MNVLLDLPACERFAWLGSLEVDGQLRSYYALQAEDAKLALLVTRGVKLPEMAGQVTDCAVGWDTGLPGFVFFPGQMHTKITAFGCIDAPHERTLSEVLDKAPERRQKG